jgi:hypothetical protein
MLIADEAKLHYGIESKDYTPEHSVVDSTTQDLSFNFILSKQISDYRFVYEGDLHTQNNNKIQLFTYNAFIESPTILNSNLAVGRFKFFDCSGANINPAGNGINTLISVTLDGIFLSHKSEYGLTKIGYGSYHSVDAPDRDWQIVENRNSDGLFFMHQSKGHELNYYRANLKYLNKNLGALDLLGYSNRYALDSSTSIYSVLGYSIYNQKINNIKDEFLSHNNIPPAALTYYPDTFNFENNRKSGYNVLIGASYDIDYDIMREITFGAEYYYTSKNFVNLIDIDSNYYSFYNKGNSYKLYIENQITKTTKWGISTTWTNKEYSYQVGSIVNPVQPSAYIGLTKDYKHLQTWNFFIEKSFR